MVDNGYLGDNVLIKVGNTTDGASTTWDTIAYLRDAPSRSGGGANVVDNTCHGDTVKRKKPGKRDEGQLTFRCLYVPESDSYALLLGLYKSSAKRDIKVVDPNTQESTESFVGFVQNVGREYPMEDLMAIDVTIEIDGETSFVANPA
jgi:hypothetical protein